MTQSVTPAIGTVEDLFQSLVWDNLVQAGLTALFVQVPFFAMWPIAPIIRYLTNLFASQLFSQMRLTVDLGLISLLNAQAARAFEDASVTLKIIGQEKGIDSDEFKKARSDAKAALAQFVRFNGV